ncbi:hypothetical protein CLAFUW4_12716 [Fulvia fulva]|uniref:Chromo domain-containing protein n=1 Tax=Passalora fulva TaxID=5499 RepID=A0A9Q8UVD4_PASFU|nr:uncharacterized protein CLAFUR5_12582 [Fulvia fulva]KAK4611767.1 hypothetical protein CLAFUR4_12720 [Fulvia fulva]KAK4612706.1 hypothetical protein CLAFUR0_12727 [Fulvia fulva]UJO23861.1 hypothetical protein CLAFUR5_12582 [Fulvia fulva]WPV21179.1 hypothetical protein CLAFUW4_12716 [Fulvia fulva]WPV36082.1 hypothetical protein CLAFUW7_12723 [Fulvia fulva]
MAPNDRLYTVNAIIKDKIMADGTMRFRVSWENYDAEHNSWEPTSSFETYVSLLSDWLDQTTTQIPVADDIELVISEASEGGFMVKRIGTEPHEHEWLPEQMIPGNLIDQMENFNEDLDTISDTMETDQAPPAANDPSIQTAAATTVPTIAAPRAVVPSMASPSNSSPSLAATTQNGDSGDEPWDDDSTHHAAQEQNDGDEVMGATESGVPTAMEVIREQDDNSAAGLALAQNANAQPPAEQEDNVPDNMPTDFNMVSADDYFDFETARENWHRERVAAGVTDTGVCMGQLQAGHTEETHTCVDPGHNHAALFTTSCKQCVAKAHGYFTPEHRQIYDPGLSIVLHTGCNIVWQDVEGLDHLCGCQSLPRCGDCHMKKVAEFVGKFHEMRANGYKVTECVRCKAEVQLEGEFVVRCAVCLGVKR